MRASTTLSTGMDTILSIASPTTNVMWNRLELSSTLTGVFDTRFNTGGIHIHTLSFIMINHKSSIYSNSLIKICANLIIKITFFSLIKICIYISSNPPVHIYKHYYLYTPSPLLKKHTNLIVKIYFALLLKLIFIL